MKLRHTSLLLGLGLLLGTSLHTTLSAQDTEGVMLDDQEAMDDYTTEGEEYTEGANAEQPDLEEPTAFGFEEIGTTVQDIENLIQLPPTARLKREADEDPLNPESIFSSPEIREALLGSKPKFVYIPVGVDPMIIPWVRQQIVVKEKLADAKRLLEQARNNKTKEPAETALGILHELQEQYPDTESAPEIGKLTSEIESFIAKPLASDDDLMGADSQMPGGEEIRLPEWIKRNTSGILLDRESPSESIVLVGDFLLKRGDRIERFPTVVLKDILPQQVIYEYQDREFRVPVQPY
ncbi:MAG: hypothetical protein PWP23_116 [Candidatus Sumerlaeota bacterium]|nr:hypothetical protein [Candidatus Sumerlaeota bacterium]